MTKADIVQVRLQQARGFSKKEFCRLVDLAFEMMKETFGRRGKNQDLRLRNFVLRDKRPRQGRNPQHGRPIVITQRRVLTSSKQILKQR